MPLATIKQVLDGEVSFDLRASESSSPTDAFGILGDIAERGGVGRVTSVYSTPADERLAAQTRAKAVTARGLKR